MQFTSSNLVRRIINSSYHPFHVIPKPSIWPKRERLRRFIAWQYGSSRYTVRMGSNKQNKIFHYMDMQRRDETRLEQFYAEKRLNAALSEHHMEYKYLRARLDEAHILLDNVVLSQLAVYEPRTFKTLIDLCKKLSEEQGLSMISDVGDLDYVTTSQDLHGKPYLKPKYYAKGADENHTQKPRKLKEEEF